MWLSMSEHNQTNAAKSSLEVDSGYLSKLLSGGNNSALIVVNVFLALLFFLIDLNMPLGVAGGIPYVLVILISLRSSNTSVTTWFSIACSLFILAGFLYSPNGADPWIVITNRLLALFAVWVTAILGIIYKQNQARLFESNARFHFITDTAALMIWMTDSSKDWLYFSRAWLDYSGRELSDEQGQGWLDRIHPDDREEFLKVYGAAFECCSNYKAKCSCDGFIHECRLRRADGNYRWMLFQGAPRFDSNDDFAGYIGTCMDITEREEAKQQLEEARSMYYHQEKLAAIGTLAAGIVHEVGNPISAISGLTQELIIEGEQEGKQDKPSQQFLHSILEQTSRLTSITRDVTDFATVKGSALELLDLNELVDRTCRLMRYDSLIKKIGLTVELASNLPAISGREDDLMQVLVNLLSNSAHACINIQHATISVNTAHIDDTVQFSVTDNGCGMTPKVAARAMEPFFSTKSVGQGTGLGLSLCNSLVKQSGGELKIESSPQQGTTVSVILPCSG